MLERVKEIIQEQLNLEGVEITEDSSFKAVFSNLQMMECQWKAHDGQQPDGD